MTQGVVIPDEVGQKYDVGIVSPTFGSMGFTIKPGTYNRAQQLVKRNDVVAALQQSIADRDISFWTRVSQFDWSEGEGQDLFTNTSMYRLGFLMDVSVQGQCTLTDDPRLLASSTTATTVGRGGVVANGYVFMPWSSGLYTYQAWNNLTGAWLTKTVPVGGTTDIATDGTNTYFVGGFTGVWYTAAGVPANAVQYDTGVVSYSRIVYDPLRKFLYGITNGGTALHRINAGGAFTLIYDFVSGVLSSIEYHDGNIVVAWNSYAPTVGSAIGIQDSAIYQWDGTNMTIFADFGDGTAVGAMKSHAGSLYCDTYSINAERHNYGVGTSSNIGPEVQVSAYVITAGVVTFLFSFDTNVAGTLIFALGAYVYYVASTYLWRYDTVNGGFSRVYGDLATNTAFGVISGLVSVWDGQTSTLGPTILAFCLQGAPNQLQVWALANRALSSQSVQTGARQITGSRMDIGLPYIDKYWYSFDVIFDPLPAGGSVLLEYSFDDGVTFHTCINADTGTTAAYNTASGTRYTALINAVNPHVTYRSTVVGPAAGGAAPMIHAIAARFAPSNPNLKVWTMTLTCDDQIRLRNNQVSDLYGQDLLTFLFNIAQQSETVTFYDANEPLASGAQRVPHTVWVMQAAQDTFNTSGVYNPLRQEGDQQVVLWEVDS